MIRMLNDSGNNPNVAKCVYVAPTKVSLGASRDFVTYNVFSGSVFGEVQRMDEEVFWPRDHM